MELRLIGRNKPLADFIVACVVDHASWYLFAEADNRSRRMGSINVRFTPKRTYAVQLAMSAMGT